MPGNSPRWLSLGQALRVRRKQLGLTQAQLGERAGCSKSLISRLELGQRLPEVKVVDRLDEEIGAAGALKRAWSGAMLDDLRRPSAPTYRKRWSHNYPAAYSQEIWMEITVDPAETAAATEVEIRWGPWKLEHTVTWPSDRRTHLWHTKGDDGLSIPVIVRSAHGIHVSLHTGAPPDDAVDINPGWFNDGR